jgi:chlorophyllide a reductase subunit X
MIAVYGKGGIGKSFFTTNLVSKLALLNQRVLQLGCDPKHDSCNALFGGVSLPTLGDTWRRFKETGHEEELQAHHVIFKTPIMGGQATVFGCEIGGPEAGRGCGGRGITFGFDLLEKLGLSQWALDYVVMDFLGDVVCGGFATPLARSLAEEIIIVCSNDRQSLYAANNIVRATQYFASMGGHARLLGLVINRDDGSGIAERFAERAGLPVLLKIPLDHTIRDLSDTCQLVLGDAACNALFDGLARAIIHRTIAPVDTVAPLDYGAFLEVFGTRKPTRMPEGAHLEDLFGSEAVPPALAHTLQPPQNGQAVGERPDMEPATRQLIARLLNEAGLYVTETSRHPKKGLMLTIDGNVTVCFGNERDLDSKIAILSALHHSGEHYHYVDLRHPSSPLYR